MKIAIPHEVYEQIQFYVDKSDIECSGLGKVVITPEGYRVTEVTLLKQENTATHTEIDAGAVTKAMYDLRNSEGGIYFWWHSHVNMGVFWSGTDKATIEEIGVNGLCVAVVFNKKREMRGAVWLKGSELSPNLYFDDVPVAITHSQASEKVKAAWAKDFEEKCKPKHFPLSSVPSVQDAFSYSGVYNRKLDDDSFDVMAFEEKLPEAVQHALALEANNLMYGFTEQAVDEALVNILALIKGTKANKHDKKKAYKEYKEMALEQKNYLAEREVKYANQ